MEGWRGGEGRGGKGRGMVEKGKEVYKSCCFFAFTSCMQQQNV